METIVLSPYNPAWPSAFEEIKVKLSEALKDFHPTIEHIGSTSVPNLAAKPVIDVMVGVQDFAAGPIIEKVETLGYVHWKEDPFHETRLMFTKWNDRQERLVNTHVTSFGSNFWKDQLTFRNKLRANKKLADEYKELKAILAKQYVHNPEKYTNAKTSFVNKVLAS